MHANSWSRHARVLAAAPATTSSIPFHPTILEAGGTVVALLVVVLLFRLSRRQPITIVNHHHHPDPVFPQGRGGGRGKHGLAKGLVATGVALGGLFVVSTVMSHHPAATATATVPAVHPTVTATPSPAPTQSGSPLVPKEITRYVNVHSLFSGPQVIILVGIVLLFLLCMGAMIINRLVRDRQA